MNKALKIVGIITGVLVSLGILFCAFFFVTCSVALNKGYEEGKRESEADIRKLRSDIKKINDSAPFIVPPKVRLPFVESPQKK